MAAPTTVVVFEVGGSRLAIPHDAVQELVRAVAVTPLLGAPIGIDGVIDVGGTLLPVYDLAPRLGERSRTVRATDHMLICDAGALGTVVIRADRVVELEQVGERVAPPAGTSTDPLLHGLVRLPGGILMLCDLAALLSAEDAAAVARAIAAVTAT